MESLDFIPRNELERALDDLQAGRVEPDAFFYALIGQQVFMPVADEKDAIKGFQRSTQATPLVIEDIEGGRVLVLFSAPERAKDFLAEYDGYGGGLLTDFGWVLQRVANDMSIAINPGLEIGLDLEPEDIAALVGLLPEHQGTLQ